MKSLDRIIGRGRLRPLIAVIHRHPSLQAATVLALSLGPMLLFPQGSPLFAAAGSQLFALSSPFLGIRHPHFWRYQLATFVFQLALLLTYFSICDKLTGGMGDDAMIFLTPFMTPLVIIPLAIVIQLAMRLMRQRPST